MHGWMRHMKTTQERRRWFADIGDNVKLRLSRAPHALPSVWDDFWRRHQRCWKEQRRTKWRRIVSK